jgi:hypothetical protein
MPEPEESFAKRVTRRLFAGVPEECLGFNSGVKFITGESHLSRALSKFDRYLWAHEICSASYRHDHSTGFNQYDLARLQKDFKSWWAEQKRIINRRNSPFGRSFT